MIYNSIAIVTHSTLM